MAVFMKSFQIARKRNASSDTSKRFREILGIVRRHKIRDGLTPTQATALLEDLGATFVKLGQIASTRPDILPREYCDAFAKLRAHATPLDFATVQKEIEHQLGIALEDVFSEFDEQATGSASLAQVHRAVLKSSGAVVAVKVQRPGVVESVTEDLAILERVVELYDLVQPGESSISLKNLVDELVRTSGEELDFTIEARNLKRFLKNNEDREGIGAPRCYEEFSNEAILVEDYLSSTRVGDIETLTWLDEGAREKLAYLAAHNFVQQVLEDGFYHADPHAGNVLIADDAHIEWIDFGMMGELTARNREQLLAIVRALVKGDVYGLQRSLLKVMTPIGSVDQGRMFSMCESLIDDFANVDLGDFDLGSFLRKLQENAASTGYEIAPFLVVLGRGLITFEGTVRMISRKLNVMQVLAGYLERSIDFASLERRARRVAATGVDGMESMAGLPSKVSTSLDMLQRGQMKMGMGLDVDDRFTKSLSGSIGTFAFAMMASALIIGSCILCTTQLQPIVLGIPLLGLVGFICGVALMVYVTFLIFRRRR